jgi:hypothetical protein
VSKFRLRSTAIGKRGVRQQKPRDIARGLVI